MFNMFQDFEWSVQ